MKKFSWFRGVVRSEKERAAAPAVIAVKRDSERKGSVKRSNAARMMLGIALNCYRQVKMVRALPKGDLVLPQGGHKYQEVYEELEEAGKGLQSSPSIATASKRATSRFDLLSILIVLRVLPLLCKCYRRIRLRPYCAVLSYSYAHYFAVRQVERRHWLIIGDLSSFLIALAGACHAAGQKVVYWQYSFLDFKHMPVTSDLAVILNNRGRTLASPRVNAKVSGFSYWRPRPPIEEIRVGSLQSARVGAMLNVHADARALGVLLEFCNVLDRTIEVRLHPNSQLAAEDWPSQLTMAQQEEPLESFARRHSLLLCGNTQAQAKALALGVPVVHCNGLDPLPFDHHGYVANGILPGCESAVSLDIGSIQQFYEATSYREALEAHMGPEPNFRTPGLDLFAEACLAEGAGPAG